MAITTLAGIKSALPGQEFRILKAAATLALSSTWMAAGFPAAPSAPAAGVAGELLTSASSGAVPFTNPASGDLYLAYANLGIPSSTTGVQVGSISLYDRLWQNSGLVATTTTAQTVNSVALTRPDANGVDAEAWFQVYAAMGSGAGGTMTITYTNEGGTGSRTGTLSPYTVSGAVGRSFPYMLQAGDRGVKSIQSETHTTTFTSGTYGLVLRRKIATIPAVGMADPSDNLKLGLPRIPNDACLEFLTSCPSTAGVVGSINLIQG